MKSVMLSIQPKWCELIASGKKTIEVRKTKIPVGSKVYIYQTKKSWIFKLLPWLADRRGKVIGEFVCNQISEYSSEEPPCVWYDLMKSSCLTGDQIEKYGGEKNIYGWHISDLKIYDKPKELREFTKYNRTDCYYEHIPKPNSCLECDQCKVERPPQSWCYVEELEEQKND